MLPGRLRQGQSLPTIGRLLGHANLETTARYAHLAQTSVKDLAFRVSDSIATDFLGERRKRRVRDGAGRNEATAFA